MFGKMEIKLGSMVRDTVTLFTGRAIACTKWEWGCVQYGVQPCKLENGKLIETEWFDKDRLVVVKASQGKPKPVTGGPPMAVPAPPTR